MLERGDRSCQGDSDDSDDEPRRTYIRRLPKLKKLKVSHKYLDLFMGKVTTLEHFHIGEAQGDIDKTKDITTFMNCQKNLEELWFMNEDYGLCTYTIDLSPGFNFKLKSLSMDREAENFTEFLDMLADDLEEMYLYMLPHPRLYESLKKSTNSNQIKRRLLHIIEIFRMGTSQCDQL